jgi:hypothetical protein
MRFGGRRLNFFFFFFLLSLLLEAVAHVNLLADSRAHVAQAAKFTNWNPSVLSDIKECDTMLSFKCASFLSFVVPQNSRPLNVFSPPLRPCCLLASLYFCLLLTMLLPGSPWRT